MDTKHMKRCDMTNSGVLLTSVVTVNNYDHNIVLSKIRIDAPYK